MKRRDFNLSAAALLASVFVLAPVLPARSAPERWEPDIRKFEAADKEKMPPAGAVLFVGSSSIVKWKSLAEDFPGVTTINRGFGGSELGDTTYFADRIVIPYAPKMVVVYAGDNDLAAGKTPEQVFAAWKGLVENVHAKLPKTRLVFISIKPSIRRWSLVDKIRATNDMVKNYAAADKRQTYVDVFTPMLGSDGMPPKELFVADGLHMTPAGYAIWTKVVGPVLK